MCCFDELGIVLVRRLFLLFSCFFFLLGWKGLADVSEQGCKGFICLWGLTKGKEISLKVIYRIIGIWTSLLVSGKESTYQAGDVDSKDPLEKEMATYSSILAWRIPWTEENGGLPSMGSQRVRHNAVTEQQRFGI